MFEDMELVVKKYYDELENGKIIACKCNKCGHVEFPPRIICNECGSDDLDVIEISGKGQALDCWTTGFATTNPDFKAVGDYGLGVVQIEEGESINAIIFGVTRENVEELRASVPFPVTACIVQRTGGYKAVAFKLDEA